MWLSLLNTLGLAWWVEVSTENPDYTYYFGPFSGQDEAEAAKGGYVQDLEQEGAQNIQATVKRTKPNRLTVEGTVIQDSQGAVATKI